MEQNKWQLILHEKAEDPYYEITNGPISLIANCGFVGEDDADEENIFRRVFDALDQSGIRFHSGNPLELTQHLKIQELQYETEALQAKCERYEKALKDLRSYAQGCSDGADYIDHDTVIERINEALSGAGEKEATDQEFFDKWVKENAAILGESHWLVGSKNIYSKKDLFRVYNYLNQKEDKQ